MDSPPLKQIALPRALLPALLTAAGTTSRGRKLRRVQAVKTAAQLAQAQSLDGLGEAAGGSDRPRRPLPPCAFQIAVVILPAAHLAHAVHDALGPLREMGFKPLLEQRFELEGRHRTV
jgi:hypothetical protein